MKSVVVASQPDRLVVFPTSLGWMGLALRQERVCGLTLGHFEAGSVVQALADRLNLPGKLPEPGAQKEKVWWVVGPMGWVATRAEKLPPWEAELIRQLQSYAQGTPVDFSRVPLDPTPASIFQEEVYQRCRQIPYGRTLTYGQVAQSIGRPKAARAVGQVLARNPIPILIPCHRVVGTGGKLVGFSAPGGLAMKQTLLELEARALPADTLFPHGAPPFPT